MKLKFITPLLVGAAILGSACTLSSCKDTDEDLRNEIIQVNGTLQERLDQEVALLNSQLGTMKTALEALKAQQEQCAANCEAAWKAAIEQLRKDIELEIAAKGYVTNEELSTKLNGYLTITQFNTFKAQYDLLSGDVAQLETAVNQINIALALAQSDITNINGQLANLGVSVDDIKNILGPNANGTYGTVGERFVAVETALNTIQTVVNGLHTDLNTLTQLYNTLDSNFHILSGDVTTLQGEVGQLTSDFADMAGDLASLTAMVNSMKGDITLLQGSVGDLAQRLLTVKNTVDAAVVRLDNLELLITDVQKTANASYLLATANAARLDAMDTLLSSLQASYDAEIATLKADIAGMASQITGLTGTVDGFTQQIVNVTNLVVENATQISANTARIDALEALVKSLQTISAAEVQAMIDALELRIDAVVAASTATNVRIDDLKSYLDSALGLLNGSIETANGRIDGVESSIDALTGDIAGLNGSISNITALISGLANSITGIEGDIDDINSQLSGMNGNIASITTSITAINSAIDAINGDLSDLGDDVTRLDNELSTTNGRLDAVNSALEHINSDLAGINALIIAANNNIALLDTRIDALSLQLTNEINRVNTELAKINTTVETLSTSLDALTSRVSANEISISQLQSDLSQLSTDVEQKFSDINGEISDIKESITTLTNTFTTEVDAINGRITAIQGAMATLEGRIDSLEEADRVMQSSISAIDGRVTALETKYTALEGRVVSLEGTVEDFEGRISANATNITANAQAIEAMGTRVSANEQAIESITTSIGTINGRLDVLEQTVSDIQGQVNALTNRVSGILIQQVYNPITGTENLPINVQSMILFAYTGNNVTPVKFPDFTPRIGNNYGSTYYIDDPSFFTGEYLELPAHTTLLEEGSSNLGKVYFTVNPANVDLTGKEFYIVNSLDQRSPIKLTNVAPSKKLLSFGISRVETSANGFYEADASIDLSQDLSSLTIDIEPRMKSAIKNMLQDRTYSSIANMMRVLYRQFDDVLPALGMKVTWDENGVQQSVYSQYNMAAATFQPLSFAFLYGGDYSGYLPALPDIDNLLDKFQFNIDVPTIKFDYEPINIETPNVNFKLNVNTEFTIKLDEITANVTVVVPAQTVKVYDDADQFVGTAEIPEQTIHTTGVADLNQVSTEINDQLKDKFERLFADLETQMRDNISASIDDLVAEVNKKVNDNLADLIKRVETEVNSSIQDAIGSVQNQVNDKIQSVAEVIRDYYQKVELVYNKIHDFMKEPNNYMQVTLLAMLDGDMHMVSNSKALPSLWTGTGTSVMIMPTTYNGDILTPSFKKYVAVSNVYDQNGNDCSTSAVCAKLRDEANSGQWMNTVVPGSRTTMVFNFGGARTNPGSYTYEIFYQALDYHGYTSTQKFYVTIK